MSSSKKKKRKITASPQQGKTVIPPTPKLVRTTNPLRFSIIITGIFFVLALFGLLNHEMWRDEHQAWLIARDAHSLSQVFENMKYEGNPALWHICLYVITCFTDNPVYMQAFHLLIACSFIFVFNRYAPIGNFYKILFTFGYFPLYEYAVISRSYGLGILLIFIACVLYKNRQSNYILLGIVLALLANVTIYGAIISLAIAGILLLDHFFHQQKNNKATWKFLAGLSVFLVGFILSIYQIWPEKDNTFPTPYATQIFELPRWAFATSKLFTTYFYFPDIQQHFWNTNIYVGDPPFINWVFWLYMPGIIFLLGLISFLRKPMVLLLYSGATLGLLSVYYYTALAHSRYCGHLLIVLIICYWLAEYYPEKKYNNAVLSTLSGLGKKINKPLLAIILLFNIAAAIVAYSMDFQYKFSPSKDVAEYIRQNKLDSLPVAGMADFTTSPVSTYLNKKIYYPQMKELGSFITWNKKRNDQLTFRQMVDNIDSFMRQGRTKILLIRDIAFQITKDGKNLILLEQGMITNDLQLILLKTFDAGIVNDEKYYIYTVQRVDSTKVDFNKYPSIN